MNRWWRTPHRRSSVSLLRWGPLACAAVLASACGGAQTMRALPQSAAAANHAAASGFQPHILSTITVDPSRASAAQARVSNAGGHLLPTRGASPTSSARRPKDGSFNTDLVFHRGAAIGRVLEYNILVNCGDESCWGGSISRFENDLNFSGFRHVSDQYMSGNQVTGYGVAGDVVVNYNDPNVLWDSDINNILAAVAPAYGAGYNVEYHVFLPQNTTVCTQSGGGGTHCYDPNGVVSPPPPPNTGICGYHYKADIAGVGHVIYSVEPYQQVFGCQSPSGQLTDATASTLSHEFFESITDPDITAWYYPTSDSKGGEIGDLCLGDDASVMLHGESWYIQKEYSNADHTCTFGAPDGTPGWHPLPGAGVAIGVGSNNAVWLLGENQMGPAGNYGIWHWNGASWDAIPGYANQIAVSPEGTPWLVTNNAAHNISRWNGTGWDVLPGGAIQIGVGSNGAAYILGLNSFGNGNYGIWKWNGSGWVAMPGYAASIAVSPEGTPWITTNNAQHTVSYWNGSSWVAIDGGAQHLGVGSNTKVYGLGLDSYGSGNFGIWHWNNPGWSALPGYASSIAVSPEGTPWVLTAPSGVISYYL